MTDYRSPHYWPKEVMEGYKANAVTNYRLLITSLLVADSPG
ncbi:MAG: hypothetical protein AB1797_08185 [bacterium]